MDLDKMDLDKNFEPHCVSHSSSLFWPRIWPSTKSSTVYSSSYGSLTEATRPTSLAIFSLITQKTSMCCQQIMQGIALFFSNFPKYSCSWVFSNFSKVMRKYKDVTKILFFVSTYVSFLVFFLLGGRAPLWHAPAYFSVFFLISSILNYILLYSMGCVCK